MTGDAEDPHDDGRGSLLAGLAGAGGGWNGVHELVALAGSDRALREPADPEGLDRISRRGMFKLVGASAALAGLAACSSRPAREIRPYVHQPPELIPGVPVHYATALVEDGFAIGVVVESHEGRPTKLEGNPDHPASLGATRAIEQAAVLSLYDPQRVRAATDRGVPAAWHDTRRFLAEARAGGGAGLHVVLEPTSSLVVIDLVERVRAALPAAVITFWSPLELRASLAGNQLAFGRALQTQLDLRDADVIVTLDADLVGDHPMALAYARQISDRRRVSDARSRMNRLYALEPAYTTTGTIADHRLRVRGVEIERVAIELLAELVHRGQHLPGADEAALPRPAGERARWIGAIAGDLVRARGRSAVVAGERQPEAVHAVAAAINLALGNVGRTVRYTEPVVHEAGRPSHELTPLARALDRGEVKALMILGGNPAYTAHADLDLAHAIARVPSLYLGLHANETAAACRHVVPALHGLEDWDVVRAYDGTITPIQPLIEPLFGGRAISELLAELLAGLLAAAPPALPAAPPVMARERVLAAWQRQLPGADFEAALALGCVASSAAGYVDAVAAWASLGPALAGAGKRSLPALELELRPHPLVHDGRYANNPWLLEVPEPITKLTWDNAAQLSPETAARLGLATGDIVELAALARTLELPAIVVPGHADDSITVHLGYGRDGGEQIARGVGGNGFRLWRGAFQVSATVTPRSLHRDLAITQGHWRMEHRPIVVSGTLAELGSERLVSELARHRGDSPTLLAKFPAAGEQWAMSIDLTTCTGCSACVMACAAENNTPVVGRSQVLNSREMHWLRIDRYVEDRAGEAVVAVQPMLCQHCENAPCEYVCPVEATTHSPDGLNEMAYNRCVGTRFCSNNCPYKVRRFNWFDVKQHDGLQILGRNPDVTVRDRGVMEKCTYCVQRIRRVEIDARIADRPIGADEVRTACQQACPTQAIAFGSITNRSSSVTEQRSRPHSYEVLHDQGTRPRTTYLARVRNPNPELE
jgi:molybdopterin-containing oxidoreductase family iron-sulfur binding subunit